MFPPGLGANEIARENDLDGAGLSNLAEYAFARSPIEIDALPLVSLGLQAGGEFAFAFARRTTAPDVIITIETSDDLVAWDSSGLDVEVLSSSAQFDGLIYVTARLKPRQAVSRFVRVRVR